MYKPLKIKWLCYYIMALAMFTDSLATPSVKLRVSGLDGKLLEHTLTHLQTKLELLESTNPADVAKFYREAPGEIDRILKLHGYFHAKTTGNFSANKNHGKLHFNVKKGPPLVITTLELKIFGEGAQDIKLNKALARLPIKTSSIFEVDQYNDAKQFLFDSADSHGYPKASLVFKEIKVDLEQNSAAITLHLDTKERCYFGITTFNDSFFNKEFLLKFIQYKPGELYANKKLRILSLSLGSFFQQIEVKPIIDDEKANIPIEITLTPRKSKQYTMGVGYGTDTGIRGSLEIKNNYVTNSCHSFMSQIQASEVQNNLEVHYLIPGKYPPTDLYDLSATGETLNFKKGDSTLGAVGASYTTKIKEWQQTLKIILQYERYNLRGHPYETSKLILYSILWSHGKKDNLIKPRQGYSININVTGATQYSLATTNFMQTTVKAKFIQSLSQKMQLLLNSSLGFTAIDDITQLPLSLQFYTGGTQSVRGFSYNSIGPGTNLILGSTTLRHQISPNFYLETFFDLGNVGNDLLKKPAQSVGLGLVWRTAIGSVELTYAKAISKSGSPGMIQLNIGPEL